MADRDGSRCDGVPTAPGRRAEQLLESVSDLVCCLDPNGRIQWANRALAEMVCLPPEKLNGVPISELVHPEDVETVVELIADSVEGGGSSVPLQCQLAGADGTVSDVEATVLIQRNADGGVVGLDVVGRDVSASRRRESEARHWRDQLDAVLRAVPFPLFAKDREGRYLLCNPAFEQFFGLSRAEIVGRTVWQCWSVRDARVFYGRDFRLMNKGGTEVYEHDLPDANGNPHRVVFSRACFYDGNGQVGGVVGAVIDVTERYRAQADAREAALLLRASIEQASTGIVIIEASTGEIVRANRASVEMLGLPVTSAGQAASHDELDQLNARVGRRLFEELPLEKVVSEGTVISGVEVAVTRDDDEVRSLLAAATPVRDHSGEIVAAVVTLVDVTERWRLLDAVSRAKREWEGTFDAVRELIVVCDSDGRVIRANRAASDRLDVAPSDLTGAAVDDLLVGPAGDETGHPLLFAVRHGRASEIGIASTRLQADLQVNVTPRIRTDGAVVGAIMVARDVTEERRAEKVRQQHVLVRRDEETLRVFRHELGNVINTLQTTFSALERRYESLTPERRVVYLQRCRESLDLAGHLHGSVVKYQELQRLELEPVDLAAFMAEKGEWLFERARDAGCTCRLEPCSQKVVVRADRAALLRIVLNLVDNAMAAVVDQPEQWITVACEPTDDFGALVVYDTGCGIPAELADRVMTPLFTTKSGGSGMGLAIVQRMMDRMGGLLDLESEPGRGTRVMLRFPRVETSQRLATAPR